MTFYHIRDFHATILILSRHPGAFDLSLPSHVVCRATETRMSE